MGKNPHGDRLKRIRMSPNYRNGAFKNLIETSIFSNSGTFIKTFWRVLNKPKTVTPQHPLPSIKTNLNNLPNGNPVLVWFGHSSYLIKLNGRHILVDPVFSGYASPFKMKSARSFEGTNVYNVDDMPAIDVLLITHDHYDHCDYDTIRKLDSKTKKIVTSLGVGSHLEYWGLNTNKVIELDWNESIEFDDGFKLTSVPARHFSGRGPTRFKTLWGSFILKSLDSSIYIGADSGYGSHFRDIGEKYGPFDLAILECGQYNVDWKNIHMMPEETIRAGVDLIARVIFPVHWGKFSLSIHPWNEPIERAFRKAVELNVLLTTPLIGEQMVINKHYPSIKWWEAIL